MTKKNTAEKSHKTVSEKKTEKENIINNNVDNEPAEEASAQTEPSSAAISDEEKDEKIKEQEEKIKRLYADFENFRKRKDEETASIRQYALERIITDLLPVIDNFERAIEASEASQDYESLKEGLLMINKQIRELLCKEGLTEICSTGQPFNPEFHQVALCENDDSCEEDTVLKEFQKGYKLKDRLIRPSMVVVSKKSK